MLLRTRIQTLTVAVLCWVISVPAFAEPVPLDRAPSMSGEIEVNYAPSDGEVSGTNPPAFVWLPHDGVEQWQIQYSPGEDFEHDDTVIVSALSMTVHIPGETMAPGPWHWRYGYEGDDGAVWSRTRSFTIPDDATAFPFPDMEDVLANIPETRPRVYHSAEDVATIRANEDGKLDWLVEPVVRAAERALAEDAPLFEEPLPWSEYGENQRDVYNDNWRRMRPYTRGMEICARAYLFTGDERFAAEAKRRLMHFMTWDVDGPSSVYWPTELGMDIAEHAPRTFDWIHDTLTEEEREICLEVLGKRIRQINEMHRSRPFEARPLSSHPGRMVGFAVEGSIVLAHEIEDAPDWLEYTLQVLWSVYPAWGGHEGGWHEGISYWSSYMRRMTQVVAELDRLGVALKDKPFFQNTGYFGLYAAYPHRPARAFGDSYEHTVTGGFGSLLYRLATMYDDPILRWYADEMDAEPEGPAAYSIWRPDMEAKAPVELPQSRVFHDAGWVAMHSDLANPRDTVFLLMKSSPFGAISHNHANQNAFVLEAYGEALAISSGYYHTYGNPHHRDWVWHTKAHNGILIDGEGQVIRSPRSRGRIIEHIEQGDWAYALGDATEAYGGRLDKALRHVVFLRPNVFVMVDELVADEEAATAQWLLHAHEEMALDEAAQRMLVSRGEAHLRVQFLTPEAMEFSQTTGWDPPVERPEDGPPQFHFTASTTEPATKTRIVTVMTAYREGEVDALPEEITLVDAVGGTALQVDGVLVLIRDPEAGEVRAGGQATREPAAVLVP